MPVTTDTEPEISELLEIQPSRVDAVGKPANGTDWLILKSLDAEKADDSDDDDDGAKCTTCKGSGKIMEGNRKCPKCGGSGIAPKVGESAKSFAERAAAKGSVPAISPEKSDGAAPSGSGPTPAQDCGTCKGTGCIDDETSDGTQCPDCGGTGADQASTNSSELNAVDGDGGKITEGAGGRETEDGFDKAILERYGIEEDDYLAKRDFDRGVGDDGGTDRDKIPAEDFAGPGRTYPITTQSDVDDAWGLRGHADDPAAVGAKIKAIAKRKGFKAPDGPNDPGAAKAAGGIVSGPNPFTAAAASDGSGDDSGDENTPGSAAWEAVDAATATQAALALMQAAECIRAFAQREAQEVAAGEGNDIFDTFSANQALCSVSDALGVMAQMAFHEGLAAQKSLDDVEKSGRRLSNKTVTALATARDKSKELADHLTGVLGDDDPAKKDASKSAGANTIDQEVITVELTTEEFDSRVASATVKALTEAGIVKSKDKASKGKSEMDQTDSVDSAKDANNKAKTKKPKADNTDLEDEADQGDDDSASSPAEGAAKAELTPEEIEARDAKKAAKKQLKKAKRAEEDAAERARVAKAIEEATAEVKKANATLEERLATVEKMAAPSTVVRTRPAEALKSASERDALDIEITRLENVVKSTTDETIRKGSLERVKELRAKRAAM